MSENTWTQIHTNGASTTFARYYKATDDTGATLWAFEKLATDYVNSIAESFGQEYFPTEDEARDRFLTAKAEGV